MPEDRTQVAEVAGAGVSIRLKSLKTYEQSILDAVKPQLCRIRAGVSLEEVWDSIIPL